MDITRFSRLNDYLNDIAKKYPNKVCLQIKEHNTSVEIIYHQFIEEIENLSKKILEQSKNGERIVLLTDNCPEGMLFYFSILAASATPVLIDPNLPPHELNNLIEKADVYLVIGSEKYISQLNNLSVKKLDFNQTYIGRFTEKKVDESDYDANLAAILFTSGTTGSPKGVMLTHHNILTSIKGSISAIDMTEQDRMLSILPIFHISSLLQNILCFIAGGTLICLEKLDNSSILDAFTTFQPTMIGVVPLLLDRLLSAIDEAIKKKSKLTESIIFIVLLCSNGIKTLKPWLLSKMNTAFGGQFKKIICGGAAANPATVRRLTAFGFTVIEAYGLTETCGPIVSTPFKRKQFGIAGIPFKTVDIKIKNQNELGEGEICIRSEAVMRGYFRDIESTIKAIENDWFYTKDIGHLQKNGYLQIIGRTEELIILPSGKKIQPSEIEKYYRDIDNVEELAVFKMPDHFPTAGSLNAVVVIKKPDFTSAKQIESAIYKRGAKLLTHMQIQRVYFLDNLPKTIMKVKRSLLPELVKHQIKCSPDKQSKKRTHDIEKWILSWISQKNNTKLKQEDIQQSFIYFGLDSLTIIQMCHELGGWLQVEVDPTTIWRFSTIQSLSAFLSGETTVEDQNPHQQVDPQESIAIIGIACRLPGVDNLDQLWELLIKNEISISEVPAERWNSDEYYSKEILPGKMNTRWGGFISNAYRFDGSFFEISPAEAENIDPQHRILLELTWEALESSGINPQSLIKTETGVYVGMSANDYGTLSARKMPVNALGPYNAIGNNVSAASGRISYFFGLQGICKSIDTACSSSLVAIHDACADLRLKNTNLAIVGGINMILSPFTSIMLSQAHMLSSEGQCKVFDANANGYVRSEGGAVLVLKRLSEALKDRDPVHAVIRGVAVNQDGRSNGITAPNGEAQVKLFKKNLKNATLNSQEIDFIEAHGTGTPLGDPVEAQSIAEVYKRNKDNAILLSSVKSNLGHLEAGAGMAGLLKAILVLQKQMVPAQVNLKQMNPLIENLKGIEILKYNTNKNVKYAAVNSFGFTGVNAQVILERAETYNESNKSDRKYHLIPLSVKNNQTLKPVFVNLLNWLTQYTEYSLSELAYTLSQRRAHFNKRCILVVMSIVDLKLTLGRLINGEFSENYFDSEHSNAGENGQMDNILFDIIQKFLKQESVDWSALYHSKLQTIPNLPSYPFNRKRYCLVNLDNLKNAEHPLLQEIVSVDDAFQAQTCFAHSFPHYIQDHKIFDLPIMAAAVSISAFVSFLSRIKNKKHIVIDAFRFLQPVVFDLNNETWLSIKLIAIGEGSQLEVMTSPQKQLNQFQIHVTAKSFEQSVELCGPTFAECKKLCNDIYSLDNFYTKVKKLNIEYGPSFQYLDAAWVGENQAFSKIKKNTDVCYFVSPGQIDSLFQLLFILFENEERQELYVPYKIKQFYFDTGEQLHYAYVKTNISAHQDEKSADFYFYNADGNLIGFIKEFIAKRLHSALISNKQTALAEKLSYFQEKWESCIFTNNFNIFTLPWLVVDRCDLNFPLMKLNTIRSTSDATSIFNHLLDVSGIIYCIERLHPNDIQDVQNYFKQTFRDFVEVLQLFIKESKLSTPFWILVQQGTYYHPLLSLVKSILMEHPEANIHVLILSEDTTEIQIADEIQAKQPETFIRYEKTERQVLRINTYALPVKLDNRLLFPQATHYKLNIPEIGLIENLALTTLDLKPIQGEEIAIQVKAVGINFRDLLSILKLYPGEIGPLGSDFSGVVTAVSDQVKNLKIGDEIFGFTLTNALASDAISHEKIVIKKPTHFTFEEAATIPSTFLTAHLALNVLAKMKRSDKVLIHAATGGVGIAAIQLAKLVGATIFATAGNDMKRSYLKSLGIHYIYDSRSTAFAAQIQQDTNGKGVDIVLNCLSGNNFIESSLSVCSSNARFLEIGKRNIWNQEQILSLCPNIKYHIIALDEVVKVNPDLIVEMLQFLVSLFNQKHLSPLPITKFNITASIDAFRYMQQAKHIGKIVINTEKIIQPIQADGSYLVTGGTGALGMIFSQWLVRNGAKHLVLVSRNPDATVKNEFSQFSDVTIEVMKVDLSQHEDVKVLFARFGTDWPQLKGIIHAAGVINDAIFPSLQLIDFERIYQSKVYGSWLLHQFSLKHHLDFFILFSSVTSAFGGRGQANYAVGNAFLDELAKWRQSMGLPALSINWGPWKEAGMATAHTRFMEQLGFEPIDNQNGIILFETALQQSTSNIILAPLYLNKVKRFLPDSNTSFKNLLTETNQKNTPYLLLTEIKHIADHEFSQKLRQALQEVLANILGMQASEIDTNVPFSEFGMDSLMMLQLQDIIETHLGKNILPSIESFNEHQTIDKLAHFIELQRRKPVTTEIKEIEQETKNYKDTDTFSFLLSETTLSKIEAYTKKVINPPRKIKLFKKFINPVLYFLAKYYVRVEVIGLENLPSDQPFVLCANHSSYLDAVVIFSNLGKKSNDLIGLFAEDYFANKSLISALSYVGNVIPFDRTNNPAALLKNLKYIELCKNVNKSLLLFPEGTRSDGKLQLFKQGVAWFLEKTDMLVIPTYIEGASRLWPKGSRIPKPGKIRLHFDKPIYIQSAFKKSDYSHEKEFYTAITNHLRAAMVSLAGEFELNDERYV